MTKSYSKCNDKVGFVLFVPQTKLFQKLWDIVMSTMHTIFIYLYNFLNFLASLHLHPTQPSKNYFTSGSFFFITKAVLVPAV